MDFLSVAHVEFGLNLSCRNHRCPAPAAACSSERSGRTGPWLTFVLALLTHHPVHHWFFESALLHAAAARPIPPATVQRRRICDPGAAPSFTPHSITIQRSLASTHTPTHTLTAAVQTQLMEHPGCAAGIKMDGHTAASVDCDAGKCICLSKRKQLNTDVF